MTDRASGHLARMRARMRPGRGNAECERGAVSVVVAILSVALIGFAAVSVDVAALWWDRQELQTGADAAALAIAADCSAGACGTPSQTATTFAKANKSDGNVTASILALTSSKVTVQTASTRQPWFAQVLGAKPEPVTAKATAQWGIPTGGTSVLPLTFSWCEWAAQTGGGVPSGTTSRTIYLMKSNVGGCSGPSGLPVPGGFGWIRPDAGTCLATTTYNSLALSEPGVSPPASCSAADFEALIGRTVLLPVFDVAAGTGNNATYRIYGYAAFTLTGYYFAGQYAYNAGPCAGNDRCIRGYFTQYVDASGAFTYGPGGPELGPRVITLTE